MTLYRVAWINLTGTPRIHYGDWFDNYDSPRGIVDYCNRQWTVAKGMFLHWVESREV